VNTGKMKTMKFGSSDMEMQITVEGQKIKNVKSFVYMIYDYLKSQMPKNCNSSKRYVGIDTYG